MTTYQWVPFDLTALPQEQQDNMFVAWLNSVANEIRALGKQAIIAIPKKGPAGPLTTNLQGAHVWIQNHPVQLLIAFNDFFANDIPNLSAPNVRRNDPADYAKRLVDRAVELDAAYKAGNLGDYEVMPRPETGDIVVGVVYTGDSKGYGVTKTGKFEPAKPVVAKPAPAKPFEV